MVFAVHSDKALAPDGRVIAFTCRAEAAPKDWLWQLRVTSRTGAVGVTVAHRDYVDDMIHVQQLTISGEIRYRGRPLVLALTEDGGGWMAGWRGEWHSAVFGGPAPVPEFGDLVALLDLLEFADATKGLVLRPLAGSGVTLWSLRGSRYVPRAGMVSAFPRSEAQGLIPPGQGKKVSGGEIWSTSLGEDADRSRKFVHVGQSAVAAVDDDRGQVPFIDASALEELLQSLRVEWPG